MEPTPLDRLEAGMPILVGGDRVVTVSDELAAAFAPGDALLTVPADGALLHVPAADRRAASAAVDAAVAAFESLGQVDEAQLDAFYTAFAERLADDEVFAPIAAANAEDVAAAEARGRSTTRLMLDARMRTGMIDGLRGWAAAGSVRGDVVASYQHEGWTLEQVTDRLGVVAFVFEGRPNVFADACGVLRTGNAVVFRIGSDALGTARAIVAHALDPALREAGLPAGAAALVDAPSRAAGWALFSDPRLALAVARGSGPAVRQLSAVAHQAGNAVSAHGTGGAWLLASEHADRSRLAAAVHRSLDRKVCNTLNTVGIARSRADELVPIVLEMLTLAATELGTEAKLHVLDRDRAAVDPSWFDTVVPIHRAEGLSEEPRAETIVRAELGIEWEWERSPELSLFLFDDLDEGIETYNHTSPRFVLSLISEDPGEHEQVWARAEAPYVGDGFTRWVDGQYALGTPELGLSNWEHGRLLGRSGILSGDAIVTVRSRVRQQDPDVHR
ncbi:MAG: aldehyde dehydrogenase family protein [Nitriliruptor sp.]|nr:MAG: aldehyde dehydrogenase family protein [Nitriliruptor sp.]